MLRKKYLKITSVFFILVIVLQTNLFFVQASGRFPFTSRDEVVYQVIDDELITSKYNFPSIAIRSMERSSARTHLSLRFYGLPNLSSNYFYWVIIVWNDYVSFHSITDVGNPNLEAIVPNDVNLTVCVAGGASWFGLVNGSCSAYYNSQGELVFSSIYNATIDPTESIFYLDDLGNFLLNYFELLPTPPFPSFGFSIFSSFFICVVVFVRKRKLI